jgi:hypothetical protein
VAVGGLMVFGGLLAACVADSDPKTGGPPGAADCPTGVSFFEHTVYKPVLLKQCIVCHTEGGMAAATRFVLVPASEADHLATNFETVREVAKLDAPGSAQGNKPLLLLKPSGEHTGGHTGGVLVAKDSATYEGLQRFVSAVREGRECDDSAGACEGSRAGRRRIRRLSRSEYDRTMQDLLGTTATHGANFSADAVVAGFDNNADALGVGPLLADQMREAAEELAEEATQDIAALAGCSPLGDAEEQSCAASFVVEFGARAFRRPLSKEETQRYTQLCELVRSEDGFGPCIGLVVQAMLQSPHFLFRAELGTLTQDNSYTLSSYEVASQLSYFIWGTMPDEDLFAAAKSGGLAKKSEVLSQAKRMLASPKAKSMVEHFASQWLGVGQVLTKAKDAATYPDFDAALRQAMHEETRRFVSHVLLAGTGKPSELFSAPYTFVNSTLASHYGMDKPAKDWSKVALPAGQRQGLLTHGSVLSTWALPGGSSPIHRGLFVRQQLFCQPLPMPPPSVNLQPPPVDPKQTTRERFAAHLSDPVCASCHDLIDPIGATFEHYDGIGRFRTHEDGKAIDDAGAIHATSATNGEVDGVFGLAAQLKDSPDVESCFARNWFRYAYGVEESAELSCLLDDVVAGYLQGDNTFTGLALALTQSEHFSTRNDDEAPAGTGIGAVSGMLPGEYPGGGGSGVKHEPDGALHIEVEENSWGNGYCLDVLVKNVSQQNAVWAVYLDTPGNVYNVWGAVSESAGDKTKFSGDGWSKQLAPDAEHAFGLCADL